MPLTLALSPEGRGDKEILMWWGMWWKGRFEHEGPVIPASPPCLFTSQYKSHHVL